jgi:hypothetical protein
MRHYATTVAALRERARAGLSLNESIIFLHDAPSARGVSRPRE